MLVYISRARRAKRSARGILFSLGARSQKPSPNRPSTTGRLLEPETQFKEFLERIKGNLSPDSRHRDSFWPLASGFSYPGAFARNIKGAALG